MNDDEVCGRKEERQRKKLLSKSFIKLLYEVKTKEATNIVLNIAPYRKHRILPLFTQVQSAHETRKSSYCVGLEIKVNSYRVNLAYYRQIWHRSNQYEQSIPVTTVQVRDDQLLNDLSCLVPEHEAMKFEETLGNSRRSIASVEDIFQIQDVNFETMTATSPEERAYVYLSMGFQVLPEQQ